MTSRAIPLQVLAQRITQQQLELEKLRREYEARQTQLRELTRRKEALQTQLQQVEAAICSVGQGTALPPNPAAASPAMPPKPPCVAGADTSSPAAASANVLTLPVGVTKILAGSPEPIPGRELADKVLASGYQTKSKNFMNVIWVGVGKMANVENVLGKGYRLKKGKTAAAASTGTGKSSK